MADDGIDRFLDGRVVAVPETRLLDVLASLLENRGADVVRCPLVTIEDSPNAHDVLAWIGRFADDPPALAVFYTGEGIERLLGFAERAGMRERFVAALAAVRKLCRGPKPKRALRRLKLDTQLEASAPTTGGILETLDTLELEGRRVAVQLYGDKRVAALEAYLTGRGVLADWVAPYVYASAANDARVAALIEQLGQGRIDAVAFTSQAQIERLLAVAEARGLDAQLREGLAHTFVAAVGPVVADALRAAGFAVHAMPEESYFMKPLVKAIAEGIGRPGGTGRGAADTDGEAGADGRGG